MWIQQSIKQTIKTASVIQLASKGWQCINSQTNTANGGNLITAGLDVYYL